MLDLLALRILTRVAPVVVPGHALHQRALDAAEAHRPADAEWCFEAAAAAYRREWAVEPMARLRVHQRMVRARSAGDAVTEAEAMLEIVRALNKLDRLESLQAPHDLFDAREVLSDWLAASAGTAHGTAKLEPVAEAALAPEALRAA